MTRQKRKQEGRIRRFLAMLLACTMIFQQSYAVFATEGETDPAVLSVQAEADAAAQAAAEEAARQQAEEAEAARIAAEQEAARQAQEAEAARIAAEQEAARIAAEEEAARKAAEEAAKNAGETTNTPAPDAGAQTVNPEQKESAKEEKSTGKDQGSAPAAKETEKKTEKTPGETKPAKTEDVNNSNGLISDGDAHSADGENPQDAIPEEKTETGTEGEDAITTDEVVETNTTETPAEVSTEVMESETEESESESESETETEAVIDKYEYDDAKVHVVATLSKASQIPDDAELVVREVTPTSNEYNYDAYMEALNDATVKEYDQSSALLYDIAFIGPEKDAEGNPTGKMIEYQPEKGTVNISVTLKQSQISNEIGAESQQDVDVLHLPLNEDVKEATETTADATNISASDISVEEVKNQDVNLAGSTDEVSFDAKDFSVFAFTVDFYYGDYEYHPEGMGTYALTDILNALKIEVPEGQSIISASLKLVEKIGEAGEDDLVLFQDENNVWMLKSNAAFDDWYELTIGVGSTEYTIKVTDALDYLVKVVFQDESGNVLDNSQITVDENKWKIVVDAWGERDSNDYITAENNKVYAVSVDNGAFNDAKAKGVFYQGQYSRVTVTDGKEIGKYIISVDNNYNGSDANAQIVFRPQPLHSVKTEFYDIDGLDISDKLINNPEIPADYYILVGTEDSSFEYYAPLSGGTLTFRDSDNNVISDLTALRSFKLVKYSGDAEVSLSALVANDGKTQEISDGGTVGDYILKFKPTKDTVTSNYEYIYKFEKKDVYKVTLNFIDNITDENPVVPGEGGTEPITDITYVGAHVRDEEGKVIGYTVKRMPTNASSNTVSFDTVKIFRNGSHSDVDVISFADAKRGNYYLNDVAIKHYTGTQQNSNDPTYDDFIGSEWSTDASDGYTFAGRQYLPDGNTNASKDSTGCIVTQRVADPTEYYVKVDCGDAPLSVPNGYKLYAKVSVNNGNRFGYVELTEGEGNTLIGQVTKWYNSNDTEADKQSISGHENNITAKLHVVPSTTTITRPSQLTEAYPANVIEVGSVIQTHKVVSYPSITKNYDPTTDPEHPDDPQREIEETPGVKTVFKDIIYLSYIDDSFDGYSLEYILNGYNVVALDGNFEMKNHTVGGVLVNGNVNRYAGSASMGDGINLKKDSFIQGVYTEINGHSTAAFHGQNKAGGDFNVYLGEGNTVIGEIVNGEDYGGDKFNKAGYVAINDNFVNWDTLTQVINSGCNELKDDTRVPKEDEYTTIDGQTTINVALGDHITIDSSNVKVNIVVPEGYDLTGNVPATVITDLSGGTISPKRITVNGVVPNTDDNGEGMSFVWNYPNATKVNIMTDQTPFFGHVLAPNAEIFVEGGNYSGCLVGKSVESAGEGHNFPYHSGKLIPDGTGFHAGKTLNGSTPPAGKIFYFELHELDQSDGTWKLKQSVANSGGDVDFDKIEYKVDGVHYYRISEYQFCSDSTINLDPALFLVKVEVRSNLVGDTNTITTTKTYYKLEDRSSNYVKSETVNNTQIYTIDENVEGIESMRRER